MTHDSAPLRFAPGASALTDEQIEWEAVIWLAGQSSPNYRRCALFFYRLAEKHRAPEPRGKHDPIARSIITNLIAAIERQDSERGLEDLEFALGEARQFMGGLHLTKPATEPSGEWQPIETAPLDKWLLLRWTPVDDNPYAITPVIGQVSSHRPGKYWDGHPLKCLHDDPLSESGYKELERITGWMPLPSCSSTTKACEHRWTVDGLRNPRPDEGCDHCGATWSSVNGRACS